MSTVTNGEARHGTGAPNWDLWESLMILLVLAVVGSLLIGRLAITPADRYGAHAVSSAASPPSTSTTGTWVSLNGPTHRHDSVAVALMKDGRILMAGGFLIQGTTSIPSSSSQIYDPTRDIWTDSAPMPANRIGGTAITLADGSVLIVGGSSGEGPPLGSTQAPVAPPPVVYRPLTNSWIAVPAVPGGVEGFTTNLLADGRMLLAGGRRPDGSTSSAAYVLDPTLLTWTSVGQMDTPRSGASSVRLADGRVLIAGGAGTTFTRTAEVFNPLTGKFSSAADMGTARVQAAAYRLSATHVLVVGGFGPQGEIRGAEIYNSTSNRWSDTGEAPFGGSGAVYGLPNGVVLSVVSSQGPPRIKAQMFDSRSNSWQAGDQVAGFGQARVVQAADGRVIAIAGARVVAYDFNAQPPGGSQSLPAQPARGGTSLESSTSVTKGLVALMIVLLTLVGVVHLRRRWRRSN